MAMHVPQQRPVPALPAPDSSTHTTPDTTPDIDPDTGPDIDPDTGPDTGPDSGPDTGELVIDLRTDSPSVTGPDLAPDRAPDAGPDTGPDTGPTAGPDTDPDSGPDSGSGSGPGASAGTTAGAKSAPASPGVGVEVARREVLPSWARGREAFTGMVRERASRAWRWSAFHALRFPWYWLRASLASPWAMGRVIRWTFDVVTDAKGRQVRYGLATVQSLGGVEGTAFHRVTGQHTETIRARLIALGVVLGALVGAGVWVWTLTPGWVWWVVLVVVLPLLGLARRDPEHPVVTSSVVKNTVPAFDTTLIALALSNLGIAALSRGLKADGLQLAGPIHRDGPGWRADVDLPGGVPAGEVIERREKLAAGLRRPLVSVWPSADADIHEARLVLWVGDKPPNRSKPIAWPLAKTGRVDLFKAFPVGVDQRGKPVTLVLMFASMLIGAIPRMGKTFALRVILLAVALDVRTELHVYDLKGGADLRPLGQVAHRFRIGDEDEDIAYLAADTGELTEEMSRRYKVIRALPERECPEGKVTPELAARTSLGLHPIVIGIDECQFAFEHPEHGAQIEANLTDLVKRGPAVGIIAILATQRPDARSIPTSISDNAVLRLALKLMGHNANNMVLGSGSYKDGIRATMFARSEKGTGYLVGEGDDPQIVRFAYIDGPTASTIANRARAARQGAGTLSGYAADLDATAEDTDPAPTLLDDLAEVMTPDAPRVWSEDLLARLVTHRPEAYTGWTPTDLGNAAGAYGVKTAQIGKRESGKVINRRGIDRTDVQTAITQRDGIGKD